MVIRYSFARGRIHDTCGLQGEGMVCRSSTCDLLSCWDAEECWCADSSSFFWVVRMESHQDLKKIQESNMKWSKPFARFEPKVQEGLLWQEVYKVAKWDVVYQVVHWTLWDSFEQIAHVISSSCIGLFSARILRDWSQNLADCRLWWKGPIELHAAQIV